MADEPTGSTTGDEPKDPAAPGTSSETPPANGPQGDEPTGRNPGGKGDDAPSGDGTGNDDPAGGGDGDGKDDDPAVKRANRQAANYRTQLRDETAAREKVEADLAAAREAATERDTLKETLDGLRKVLDPNAKEDEPVDPEELTRQFETERAGWNTEKATLQAANRELRVKNVLPDAFRTAGADPALTLAVLQSEGTLGKLDPDAETFADDAKAAVDKALEAHPRLKATREGPRRSGTEPTGPTNDGTQLTLEQYQKLSPEEAVKAQREGRCRNLLGG